MSRLEERVGSESTLVGTGDASIGAGRHVGVNARSLSSVHDPERLGQQLSTEEHKVGCTGRDEVLGEIGRGDGSEFNDSCVKIPDDGSMRGLIAGVPGRMLPPGTRRVTEGPRASRTRTPSPCRRPMGRR